MSPAEAVLAVHVVVIAFNVFGLVAVPLGAWLGWGWVRIAWWRWLHVASLAVVAVQAAVGQACFLTLWQGELEGAEPETPLIMGWVNSVIYWPLPMWFFTALYLLVFAYTLALLKWVPPRRRRLSSS